MAQSTLEKRKVALGQLLLRKTAWLTPQQGEKEREVVLKLLLLQRQAVGAGMAQQLEVGVRSCTTLRTGKGAQTSRQQLQLQEKPQQHKQLQYRLSGGRLHLQAVLERRRVRRRKSSCLHGWSVL